MRKFVLFIIIIGIVLGILGFWFYQKNPFSKEILKLEIIGPDEAGFFEEIEYTVKYKNNGDVRLEEARLIFEFPENSLLEEGLSLRQEIEPEELGDIYPGEEKTLRFKGRLFGKEGDLKEAKVWMTYRPKDLSAFYDSETTFTTVIKSVAFTFDFDLSSKIEKGRDFKFSLNYFSNLDYPIAELGIKIEYPDGFEFLRSSPESLENNEWELPLLNKAEGGRIEIEGRLSGDIKDKRFFKAILGLWKDGEFIPLKEIDRAVEIVKPQLSIFQRVNGSDNYTAQPGDSLHYEVFFRNISDDPFSDLFLVVALDSDVFDLNSIRANSGKFTKGDNSIIWDWRDVSDLRYLDRGQEGKVDFWIDLKDGDTEDSTLKNSVLVSHVKEEFEIKISSKLDISQEVYFDDEVFGNSGPIPPKAGEITTYTVVWQVKNYYNDVKNVTVRAILPSWVDLTGDIFPRDEALKFTFDKVSREIVWRVGDMEAGKGVSGPAPMIAFKVVSTPTPSQIGKTASIIGEARIKGEDQWTDKITEGSASAVDTTLPDDSTVSSWQGIIE